MKKLYMVELKYVGVVLAESKEEAETFSIDIAELGDDPKVQSKEINNITYPFDENDRVFHFGNDDITFAEAIEMTKGKA